MTTIGDRVRQLRTSKGLSQQALTGDGISAGYVSLIDRDFNRAGEDAWLIGLAYDFGRLGVTGLSAFCNFAQGTGARDPATGEL